MLSHLNTLTKSRDVWDRGSILRLVDVLNTNCAHTERSASWNFWQRNPTSSWNMLRTYQSWLHMTSFSFVKIIIILFYAVVPVSTVLLFNWHSSHFIRILTGIQHFVMPLIGNILAPAAGPFWDAGKKNIKCYCNELNDKQNWFQAEQSYVDNILCA
jgi:hypothetical protein